MSVEQIQFTIPNWNKFNPRSDRANFTWFRLSNNFFHDQSIFCLSETQKLLYLFVLCEASKKNSGTVTIRTDYLSAITKTAIDNVENDVLFIQSQGLFETDIANQKPAKRPQNDAAKPTKRLTTNERTNERTDVTNEPDKKKEKETEIHLEERSTQNVDNSGNSVDNSAEVTPTENEAGLSPPPGERDPEIIEGQRKLIAKRIELEREEAARRTA